MPADGLSETEAQRRLAEIGPNVLPTGGRHPRLVLLAEVVREPLVLLLLAAGALYVVFGEATDAALLLGIVALIVAIDFTQSARAESAVDALRAMAQPEVMVLRDGRPRRAPLREIVPEDVVLLLEGDRIPADGRILENDGLLIDESILTGESVPVGKSIARGTEPWRAPGGDGLPFAYGQTLVVRGRGRLEVTATGSKMEVGRVAQALGTVSRDVPILHRQTRALVLSVSVIAVVLSVAVALILGIGKGLWVEGLLAGITLAIALLPEEIPVVLSVYSALGARRMAARRALPRRLSAIPTLGAVTVLCSDKTGTITLNRMAVARVAPDPATSLDPEELAMSPPSRLLLRRSIEASDPDPADPMEKALIALPPGASDGPGTVDGLERERHLPLHSSYLAMGYVWGAPSGDRYLSIKGAPESVLSLCPKETGRRPEWERTIASMASEGLRILGVAHARLTAETDVAEVWTAPERIRFDFLGLIGFADPIRPDVPAAVRECRAAGIRVVMITGDHPETAQAVARRAGIDAPELVRTGAELSSVDPGRLREIAATVNVYARVAPEQKLQLVRALKANGEVVAMTGDGVNDAPALGAADIGIAMGERGSDVAREASSLILLDDAFPTIVEAVRSGRRIAANMRKAVGYLLAVHVAIAGMALLPLLLGLPLLLLPIEIVFLQLSIDPTSALAFEAEPEEADVMATPPRNPREPLLRPGAIGFSLVQGAGALTAASVVYVAALDYPLDVAEARALSFSALVFANIFLILVNRSWSTTIPTSLRIPNRLLWGILASAVLLLAAALYLPPLSALFGFQPPSPLALGVTAAIAVAGTIWVEPLKARFYRAPRPVHKPVPAGAVPSDPR